MRGYFGIGVEGISKPMNVGNLLRSAHSFGASFFFTVNTEIDLHAMRESDTSGAFDHIPFYNYQSVGDLKLPRGTSMVAVELVEGAVELPSFRHPAQAVYVLGPEKNSVSPEMLKRCQHVIKIPMKFCVNVGVAGAIVMYDRLISLGKFAPRPVKEGGPVFMPEDLRRDQIISTPNDRPFTPKSKR
ncbi:MAG TPA: RNA methyltransferase [Patescibacteria group bacterium]|nr:RNA methyltransferase [Patescibacteria group bacterium]